MTFREVGFSGGYYTINELPPAAEFTHFYTYGPWFNAFYGLISRITGWQFVTFPLFNSALLALMTIIFCYATRLTERQVLLTGVWLVTFWELVFYLHTGMQEIFQHSLAIMIAIVFCLAFAKRTETSLKVRLFGFMVITIAAILRTSWAILYIPFLMLTGRNTLFSVLRSVFISGVMTGLVLLISNETGAPGNNSVFSILSFLLRSGSPVEALRGVWPPFAHNLRAFLSFGKNSLDVAQTGQVVILVVFFAVFTQRWMRQRKAYAESAFHLYNLGGIILASCLLYIIGTLGDYRVIATHLMISTLVMIAARRYRLVYGLIISNLLFAPIFLSNFNEFIVPKFPDDQGKIEAFGRVAQEVLHYDPLVANSWCNTLYFHIQTYVPELGKVPAGIGLSFFAFPLEISLPPKSSYLLLDDEDYQILMARPAAPRVEFLAATSIGTLYRNLSAECPP